MPDSGRPHDVRGLTAIELERTRRELRASLALVRADSPARVPILAHLSAVDAELAGQAQAERDVVKLTPGQLARIGQLSDQWSFLWDKRRSLWIAAEDCPMASSSKRPTWTSCWPGYTHGPVYRPATLDHPNG